MNKDILNPPPVGAGAWIEKLMEICKALRDPVDGCPWDVLQTHETLRNFLIEEAYETVDAIDTDHKQLPKELGDVLFQVVLHSELGRGHGTFTLEDVARSITTKIVERHPHVFGDGSIKYKTPEEVRQAWERNKKKKLDKTESILDSIPRSAPELVKAHRIGDKCERIGFDYPDIPAWYEQLKKEVIELEKEITRHNTAQCIEELGDVMFSAAQLARKLNVNAEQLLKMANDKFMRRFKAMEAKTTKAISELSMEEAHKLWDSVKAEEQNSQ